MKNDVALKLAASSILIGMTMVSCKPAASMFRPAAISSRAPRAQEHAADVYAKAEAAIRANDYAKALPFAEQAVALSPRDVAYRMVLADLYVKNGRFQSAETTYGDVLALNPDNHRAAMSRALAQIAQGKKIEALGTLDRLAAVARAGDVGLAYALAGQPQRAVDILENAARADGADARTRQNLALSYALAGNWQKARVIAAQDMSAADVGTRMEQWAAFAQPATSYDQVASLLGVHPAADAGQPVQLALAPVVSDGTALAAATPEPQPAPVAVAEQAAAVPAAAPPAEIVAEAVQAPAPAVATPAEVKYAAAAETLVKPEPAVIAAPAAPYKVLVHAFASPEKPKVRLASANLPKPSLAPSKFVVQLGAFSKEASIDHAWAQAQARYGLGGDEMALTTTIDMPGKGMLHRLSVSGFSTRGDASRLCASIQAKGGSCFVRATAGDAPVQWAMLRQRSHSA